MTNGHVKTIKCSYKLIINLSKECFLCQKMLLKKFDFFKIFFNKFPRKIYFKKQRLPQSQILHEYKSKTTIILFK
jgi:hypothetical protein